MKSHSEQVEELQQLRQQISKERELLKEQQAYNESAPLELKIAVAHMEQAKKDKSKLENELKYIEKSIKEANNVLCDVKRNIESDTNNHKAKLKINSDKIKSKQSEYTNLLSSIKNINEEIKTRKIYLKDQEKLISDTESKANESLEELQNRYSQLDRSIHAKELEEADLNSKIYTLIVDKDNLEQQLVIVVSNYEAKTDEAKEVLHKVQADTQALETRQKIVEKAIEERKNELRTEIESLDIKLAAIHKESQELDIKKRRISSADNIFDL